MQPLTQKPELTIAIPFGKGVDYLKRTLSSIFSQPAGPWTVLLINNANEPDRSAARTLAMSFDPKFLRYVENEQQIHPCENFNRCIDLAETDLVSTVHADDEVEPAYAFGVLDIARRYPSAAAYFLPWRIIGPNSSPRGSFVDWYKGLTIPRGSGDLVLDDEVALRSLLRGNWINGAAICFRKSVLRELRWDSDLYITSDLDLWIRIILSGRTMAGPRGKPIYLYRRHDAQATTRVTANLDRFTEEAAFYDKVAVAATAHGWLSAARVARSKTIIKLYLAYVILKDILSGAFDRAGLELGLLSKLLRSSS